MYKFNTLVKNDGNQLRVSVPEFLKGTHWEVVYDDGLLYLNKSKSGVGVMASFNKLSKKCVIQFGCKKWVPGMPHVSSYHSVESNGESIEIQIGKTVKKEEPVLIRSDRDKALACIKFLNDYSQKNGYEFDIKDGNIRLVRSDVIG